MEKFTTIYVVRHGQSIGNTIGNMKLPEYGELESPLSELGNQQAKEIAHKLKDINFSAIFSSDLNRARETAEYIAKERNLPVITESTIRERFWGNGDKGFAKAHREEIEKGLRDLNDEEKLLYRYFPDGETGMEAVNRFNSFLLKVIPEFTNKIILVINHGNVMRNHLINLKWTSFDDLPPGSIENTGYYILETDGKDFKVTETYKINKQNQSHEE